MAENTDRDAGQKTETEVGESKNYISKDLLK